MKKMTLLIVMAVSSASHATLPPEKVAPTPYVSAPQAVQGEARPVLIDEGLRRINFELRIQNAKLSTEVDANKRTMEGQNASLINLTNQASALHGELRNKEASLATEKAMRLAAEREKSELQEKLAEGGERMFNEFFGVIIILAAISAVLLVLTIIMARNIDAVEARLPSESSKEFVDGVGAEFEDQAAIIHDLRELLMEEKARADRFYENVIDLKKKNRDNADAMKAVLDELGCDFRDLLKEEERKSVLLRRKRDEAVELAEFREFEIAGLKKRLLALHETVEDLRRKLADADETIVAMNGGNADDPSIKTEPTT